MFLRRSEQRNRISLQIGSTAVRTLLPAHLGRQRAHPRERPARRPIPVVGVALSRLRHVNDAMQPRAPPRPIRLRNRRCARSHARCCSYRSPSSRFMAPILSTYGRHPRVAASPCRRGPPALRLSAPLSNASRTATTAHRLPLIPRLSGQFHCATDRSKSNSPTVAVSVRVPLRLIPRTA